MAQNSIEQKEALALKIIRYCQDQIITQMPFLSRAVIRMPVDFYGEETVPDENTIGLGTDGEYYYCIPDVILNLFEKDPCRIPHAFLHMILHCLFNHMFSYERMNPDLYDFSVDAAVESVIHANQWPEVMLSDDIERITLLSDIQEHVQKMNAESIYKYMKEHPEQSAAWISRADLVRMDVHHFWYAKDQEGRQYAGSERQYRARAKTHEKWRRLERAVEQEIHSYEKAQGYQPGTILRRFALAPSSSYDFSEFLRKFAASSEEVHVNQDEFDYVYYTYGMNLYGNMPLIEPLEYREDNRIRDFVIAIDTSGSVQGRLVRSFLEKTWEILNTAGSFFYQVNLHIIQCDSKIQNEAVIHNQNEFREYMKNVELSGFGGTDFRPVFTHVEDLKNSGAFHDLRGLLYFTDGKGTYPNKVPDYKTAFIFVNNSYEAPPVPSWAIRLVVPESEFREAGK